MSNLSRIRLSKGDPAVISPGRRSGWRKRAPYYVAGIVLMILMAAYFDGGEEPIRPITQAVTVADSPAGNE